MSTMTAPAPQPPAGVAETYRCKKCPFTYQSPVPILSVMHRCKGRTTKWITKPATSKES